MKKPSLTVDPCALFLALKRAATREAALARHRRHPGLLRGLFTRPAPSLQRERRVRLPSGETITSNLPIR